MIEKYLFRSASEFSQYVKKYCQDSDSERYYISKPKSYPCIGLMICADKRVGSEYSMEEFVYLSDFVLDVS